MIEMERVEMSEVAGGKGGLGRFLKKAAAVALGGLTGFQMDTPPVLLEGSEPQPE